MKVPKFGAMVDQIEDFKEMKNDKKKDKKKVKSGSYKYYNNFQYNNTSYNESDSGNDNDSVSDNDNNSPHFGPKITYLKTPTLKKSKTSYIDGFPNTNEYYNNPYKNPISNFNINYKYSNPSSYIYNTTNSNSINSVNNIKKKLINLEKEIRRDKLYINLIFYDENISNENKHLYDAFQLNVVGGLYGLRDVNLFKTLLNRIEEKGLPYILVTSGSAFRKIYTSAFISKSIQSIIIYCYDKEKYKNLFQNYKKLELITNNFGEVANCLKEKRFYSYDIKMSNQIYSNPLISFYEYENCYFVFHKALAFFFQEDYSEPIFNQEYLDEVINFIEKDKEWDSYTKKKLINGLTEFLDSQNFAEDFIKEYTSEAGFVYSFNKLMRRFESGILYLSFFMGPMYYSLVRYAENNKKVVLNKSTTLYRIIKINDELDLNFFNMEKGNIVCFPSFTSTSLEANFTPTSNAKGINKISNEDPITIKMVLEYKHYYINKPIGIILGDLSYFKSEQEVLLFPYTFIRINSIKKTNSKNYTIFCDIINRESILEFGLKKNMKIILSNGKLKNSF